jgi:hypothetical protein
VSTNKKQITEIHHKTWYIIINFRTVWDAPSDHVDNFFRILWRNNRSTLTLKRWWFDLVFNIIISLIPWRHLVKMIFSFSIKTLCHLMRLDQFSWNLVTSFFIHVQRVVIHCHFNWNKIYITRPQIFLTYRAFVLHKFKWPDQTKILIPISWFLLNWRFVETTWYHWLF